MKTVQQKYRISHYSFKIGDQYMWTTLEEGPPTYELFQDLVSEVIDESLFSLGESVKQAIYFHLEKSFSIKKSEIPTKIDEFVTAIENIFGEGAKLIEIEIMKQLHARLGYPLDGYGRVDELVFSEFVKAFADTLGISQNHGLKQQ